MSVMLPTKATLSVIYYGAAVVLLGVWLIRKILLTRRQLPLPPGPKGLPIIGNINDLPPPGELEWRHWLKHKDLYGPISSVTTGGQTIVLIHDIDLALELLEKRGGKYGVRPTQVFVVEMVGLKNLIGSAVGQGLRLHRKMAAIQLGTTQAVTRFHPDMERETRRLLLRNMRNPDNLFENLQKQSAALMLRMLYGYSTAPETPDPLVHLINRSMDQWSKAGQPGAWMVDIVPAVRYLPEWLPGMGFMALGRKWRKDTDDLLKLPVQFVRHQMASGTEKPSYVSRHLQSVEEGSAEWALTESSAASLYGGGADTTVSTLAFFYLAMSLFPDVQRKAQAEIDSVVGQHRLPSFADYDKLPYVGAVVKEAMRWHSITPLALPHMAEVEDEVRGYRIPQGAIIMANTAWFSQNPSEYPDPEQFRPERFLGPNPQLDPHRYAFGFGRRICPGRLLADSSIFLTISNTLAAFTIGKAVDPQTGMFIEPVVGQTPGLVSHPTPYQCSIVARNDKYAEIVRAAEVEHPWEEGDAAFLKGFGLA